jgi:transcriptional regulatory protein LevR
MNVEIKEKINNLLHSDAVNYLETSERLIIKNILEKEMISELEILNLYKIVEKYKKFIKN